MCANGVSAASKLVPAHVEIRGIKFLDKIVKSGILRDNIDIVILYTMSEIVSKLKKSCFISWQEE